MSKKRGQRKRRKKPRPLLSCQWCHMPVDKSPGEWLKALAGLLNDAEQSGVKIRVAHGIMMTREGYVLRRGSGRWGAGMLTSYGDDTGTADEDWDQQD